MNHHEMCMFHQYRIMRPDRNFLQRQLAANIRKELQVAVPVLMIAPENLERKTIYKLCFDGPPQLSLTEQQLPCADLVEISAMEALSGYFPSVLDF